ncbi:MAG: choice-of-anchor D domain-containing protein, partial [candidate division KSB1 bacterium]|nr:choice-of-anchor D domain-containing protein [candidate division KSB1 bacterium]
MSKIRKSIFLLPAMMLLLYTLVNAQNNVPAINNLTADQRAGSNLIDIHFDLSDLDGELLLVRISITNNGIVINTPSLSGDVGFNVSADTGKHVIWDAGADYFDQFGEYVVVKVEASDALSDAVAYSDPFTVDTRIDKPPVAGWQVVTDSGRSYNENILIDNDGRIWCFYLRSPGSHQPVYMKVIDSDGYVIKSEHIISRASALVSDEKQTIRALLNPKTEDIWVVIQGSQEGTHTGHFMIFDELMNVKKDSTVIPASDHVIAPKVAADSSGTMWFSWHTDTSSAGSRGAYISCSSSGEFDPAGASYFTDFSYVINTDIAIDSNDNIWFLYERNEEAGYIIYDTEKALIGTDIYSTEPLEYDARKSILADHRNNTVWALQKNVNTEFYRLNGFDIQPAANFGGINLAGESTFFINENKRLELVRYNSGEKAYENSVYSAVNGEVSQSWSTLFSDLPSPGAVYDYAAYNPAFPNLKAYLVKTDEAMTKVKLTDVIPESITLALSRDNIDFGNVGLDTSKTEHLTIYNTGNSTLSVNDMFTTNSHYTLDKTSLSIEPQDSAQVAITFIPTDLQIVSSNLKIYTNAVESIQTVPLVGEGYERIWRIAVSPDTLDFDSLGVGYQTNRSFSINNTGTEFASIRSISVNQIQFSVDDSPFSISAGESRNVQVRYTPQFVGLSTGRALITSNAESAVDSVILMGVGTETVWSLRTNPDTVDFDLVPIGYTDVDTFVIVNTGTEPFDVDSISVDNEHFDVNEKFGYSIEAGDSHFVQVAFSPTHTEPIQARAVILTEPEITGLHVSSLSSSSQRSNEDNVVTLSGIGFYLNASKIEITPRSLDFDSVQTKSSKTLTVNVRNSGSELLSVTNIVVDDNQFSIENNDVSFNLLTGESREVGIVFTPLYGLAANAEVVFYSNDPIDNQ